LLGKEVGSNLSFHFIMICMQEKSAHFSDMFKHTPCDHVARCFHGKFCTYEWL